MIFMLIAFSCAFYAICMFSLMKLFAYFFSWIVCLTELREFFRYKSFIEYIFCIYFLIVCMCLFIFSMVYFEVLMFLIIKIFILSLFYFGLCFWYCITRTLPNMTTSIFSYFFSRSFIVLTLNIHPELILYKV